MNCLSKWTAIAFVVSVSAALSGCPTPVPGPSPGPTPAPLSPLPPPSIRYFEIPDPNGANAWLPSSQFSPPAEVLPVKGRGLRIYFTAPIGSTFGVTLRAPNGALTPLPENRGNPAPADDGYFQIANVNTSATPVVYQMYVRAPLSLADAANYDVLTITRSLRTDVTDSAPMILSLRKRKVFTVTVAVKGAGNVSSIPDGIHCGRSISGGQLTACTFNFPPGPVQLVPRPNDIDTTKWISWEGNCAPNVKVCTFALLGAAAFSTTANFGPLSNNAAPSACPVPPPVTGFRWKDLPACATGNIASHPGISNPAMCDTQGFFCCEPGPSGSNAPRCGGIGKIESIPDCRHHAPRGKLIQPGGCYEVDD